MTDIHEWIKHIYMGGSGLRAYNRGVRTTIPVAMEWVIRCLGNPRCEGSQEVLDAIMVHRLKKDV